ncbi:hypothetical protein DMH04_13070 [Kibdelosporangium aridum]|uniref:Uncharacterized protein n=1 Tax=Kibdelosporangium aridum TaxID=2030 RepID=A0A428ZET8_KIBAR|nr:hypothetical protein [Kibdelosporangium aridum]RSM86576.1 hypothetical protein DMH04_13070 [Kibdelosporangium aridum]
MGVPWGVVAYPESADRAEIIAEWGPLAHESYEETGFNILHGTDRIHFLPGAEPTVHSDPEARARVDALPSGDGTYDDFERLFDGYELFVPWDVFGRVKAPGSRVDGKFAVFVPDLVRVDEEP